MTVRKILAVGSAVVMLLAAGCAASRTDTNLQSIRYSGGELQAEKFKQCHKDPALEYGDWGDHVYYYPAGQRTFTFGDDPKASNDTGPLSVNTSNQQPVIVRGFITFELSNDCGVLQPFHERIGKKYGADFTEGATEDEGWSNFLADYMTVPVNSIADASGLKNTWQKLYADPKVQADFETAMKTDLPDEVNKQIGVPAIKIIDVSIQKPELNPELLKSVQATEQTKAAAAAKQAEIDGEIETEKKRKDLAIQKAATARECQKVYDPEQCLILDLAAEGDIPFYPIPPGGSVNVTPGGER